MLLLGGVALGLAYLPLLVAHLRQLWLRPHYGFLPFVLLGAAVLAVVRLRGPLTRAAPPRGTTALAAAAWVLLVAAELLYSPWLGAVAALTALAAAALGAGGVPLLRRLGPCLAMLALLVPPPFELDRSLILALQRLTTAWAGLVLDYLGVPHVLAGNVVEINGRRLLVEEACSGINSLLPTLACSLFFVLLVRRPPVRAALLVAAAVAWALTANMARVVVVASLSASHGLDLTTGRRHEAVGFVLFGVVLALVWSTDKLLEFLAAPTGAPMSASDPCVVAPPPRPWFAAWPVALAFLAVPALHFWAYGRADAREWPAAADAVAALDADALPACCALWERQGFTTETRDPGSSYGETSRAWTYRHGADVATASLDYPFPDWHDLTRCYTSQGWVIDEETVHDAAGAGDVPGGYVEVKLSQPAYQCGYLLFCQFDGRGRPLPPRHGGARLALSRHESALRQLGQLVRGSPAAPPDEPGGPVYQFQLLWEGSAPPTPVQQQQARVLFLEGWKSLRRHWPEEV
jgi:exosortase